MKMLCLAVVVVEPGGGGGGGGELEYSYDPQSYAAGSTTLDWPRQKRGLHPGHQGWGFDRGGLL